MTDGEITVAILKEIRDAVRGTNERLDGTNARIDDVSARLDQTRVDLGGRLERVEGRLAVVEGAVLDLAEQQRFVVRYLKGLTLRDERLEGDVADLRVRVESLEAKIDPKGP